MTITMMITMMMTILLQNLAFHVLEFSQNYFKLLHPLLNHAFPNRLSFDQMWDSLILCVLFNFHAFLDLLMIFNLRKMN